MTVRTSRPLAVLAALARRRRPGCPRGRLPPTTCRAWPAAAARPRRPRSHAVAAYWTPERMRSARSADELRPGRHARAGLGRRRGGRHRHRRAARAAGQAHQAGRAGRRRTSPDGSVSGYGLDRHRRGRGGRRRARCSSPSAGPTTSAPARRSLSANESVVLTAGHCLHEGPGAFATNFAFVPGLQATAPAPTAPSSRPSCSPPGSGRRPATSSTTSASPRSPRSAGSRSWTRVKRPGDRLHRLPDRLPLRLRLPGRPALRRQRPHLLRRHSSPATRTAATRWGWAAP